ncbi:PREDICTED: peroxidase E5-like [Tarenaya hassleriana]|uniref:peroxidase E5-like n=1 Tax=Tarenaya hassleriana TaxID=28532 RepID=UPI00053C8F5E|nr:PREDICTED: peroxidase E5-like [Tarenaya hassleriana]
MNSNPSSSPPSFILKTLITALGCVLIVLHATLCNAQLSPSFYDQTCPKVFDVVKDAILHELRSDPRIAASILRLHFHDCFVHGCDTSILLDNTTSFRTEKDAVPNVNSARGFEVIDRMKAAVEETCPGVVSCADLLAIAAQEGVYVSGGPSWMVPLGRRDSLDAFFDLANSAIPAPFFTLDQLKASFAAVGLDRPSDLVALSGGHTFGKAQCRFILDRLYNFNGTGLPDPTLKREYLGKLRRLCPKTGNKSALVDLDRKTPKLFDNKYYSNLREGKGLIQSDQELFSTPVADDTIALVKLYSKDRSLFFDAFVGAMTRMGNVKPLMGDEGEIRLNCRVVNDKQPEVIRDSSADELASSI